MKVLLSIVGTWVISDGIYSWVLYANSQSWRGEKQNFKKDNWVRLVRIICGVALVIGAICE